MTYISRNLLSSLFVHGLPNAQGHGSIPTYWEKGRS